MHIEEKGRYMTTLRQSAIEELERVLKDKLTAIIQFINNLMGETAEEERGWELGQFIMSPAERGQNADAYVRKIRDNDRF